MNNGLDILTNLSLCSGFGLLDKAAKETGRIKTICYVEKNKYRQGTLMSRFQSGDLDQGAIWDNIKTLKSADWKKAVDIVSGGIPCQPFSIAGKKKFESDKRNLWPDTLRIVDEIKPSYCLFENVSGLVASPYFGTVIENLEKIGYNVPWPALIAASDVGAPHKRERIWIVAYSHRARELQQERRKQNERRWISNGSQKKVAYPDSIKNGYWDNGTSKAIWNSQEENGDNQVSESRYTKWWDVEPDVGRVAYGVPFRLERLSGLGEAVVWQQALPAWEKILEMAGLGDN